MTRKQPIGDLIALPAPLRPTQVHRTIAAQTGSYRLCARYVGVGWMSQWHSRCLFKQKQRMRDQCVLLSAWRVSLTKLLNSRPYIHYTCNVSFCIRLQNNWNFSPLSQVRCILGPRPSFLLNFIYLFLICHYFFHAIRGRGLQLARMIWRVVEESWGVKFLKGSKRFEDFCLWRLLANLNAKWVYGPYTDGRCWGGWGVATHLYSFIHSFDLELSVIRSAHDPTWAKKDYFRIAV